jgi:RNA polymerase sigma factor (sigma-70 family)
MYLHRAVQGNTEALAWLVERLSPLLMAQASYRLGPILRPHYDPEDLVHEAWLTLLPRLGDLASRTERLTPALLKFLSSTLLLHVRNLLRKHARAGGALPDPDSESVAAGGLDALSADATSVVAMAFRRELRGQVAACLADLSPADREVIVLRGIEQQPSQTVAMLLGVNAKAVGMRYHRALQRLRARLPASVFAELED